MKQANSPTIYTNTSNLGNITSKLSSPTTSQPTQQSLAKLREDKEAQERRLYRWALQAEARYILPDERVAFCLQQVIPLALGVEILHHPSHQTAHYGGLIQCGSVWHCPLCAAKISERRRSQELEPAIVSHVAHDGAVYLETYTVSHTRFDCLPDLLRAFLKARERKRHAGL